MCQPWSATACPPDGSHPSSTTTAGWPVVVRLPLCGQCVGLAGQPRLWPPLAATAGSACRRPVRQQRYLVCCLWQPAVAAAILSPPCPDPVTVGAHRAGAALRTALLQAPDNAVSAAARSPQWSTVGELVQVSVRRSRRVDACPKPHGPFSLGEATLAALATVAGTDLFSQSGRGLGCWVSLRG